MKLLMSDDRQLRRSFSAKLRPADGPRVENVDEQNKKRLK